MLGRGVAIFLVLVVCGAGCATTRPVPEADVRVGALTSLDGSWRRIAFERQHGGCTEALESARIGRITANLTSSAWQGPPVSAGVLRSQHPNAYVLPSGHVYVTAGILDLICTEDELAAVIAHELAHLLDLSTFDPSEQDPDERLFVEVEADGRAIELLLRSNYDPVALATMIDRLSHAQPSGWADYRCGRLNELIGVFHLSSDSDSR